MHKFMLVCEKKFNSFYLFIFFFYKYLWRSLSQQDTFPMILASKLKNIDYISFVIIVIFSKSRRNNWSSNAGLCAPSCLNKWTSALHTSKPHSSSATWLSCHSTYFRPRTKWFLWHQVLVKFLFRFWC